MEKEILKTAYAFSDQLKTVLNHQEMRQFVFHSLGNYVTKELARRTHTVLIAQGWEYFPEPELYLLYGYGDLVYTSDSLNALLCSANYGGRDYAEDEIQDLAKDEMALRAKW